jgi:hypothetical protein
MPKTALVWTADDAFNNAFSAQVANVTYHVTSRDYGYPAYLEVRGQRGGLKRLDLGNYAKIEQAKWACERHYTDGCDLSRAEKITHYALT